VNFGTLSVDGTGQSFAVLSGKDSKVLTIDGPLNTVQTAVSLLSYVGDADMNFACCGLDLLVLSASCRLVLLAQKNSQPRILTPTLLITREDTVTSLSSLNLSDPDNCEFGDGKELYTLNLSSNNGAFSFEESGMEGIVIDQGNGTDDAVVEITATLERLSSVLDNGILTYRSNPNYHGGRNSVPRHAKHRKQLHAIHFIQNA
jgi:hypothetical protein